MNSGLWECKSAKSYWVGSRYRENCLNNWIKCYCRRILDAPFQKFDRVCGNASTCHRRRRRESDCPGFRWEGDNVIFYCERLVHEEHVVPRHTTMTSPYYNALRSSHLRMKRPEKWTLDWFCVMTTPRLTLHDWQKMFPRTKCVLPPSPYSSDLWNWLLFLLLDQEILTKPEGLRTLLRNWRCVFRRNKERKLDSYLNQCPSPETFRMSHVERRSITSKAKIKSRFFLGTC